MRALRPRSQPLGNLLVAAEHDGPIFCEACRASAIREFATRDFETVRLPVMWLCSECRRLAPGRFRGSVVALEVEALIVAACDDLIDELSRCGAVFARPAVRYYFLGVTETAAGAPAIVVELVKGTRSRRLCLPLGLPVPSRWEDHLSLVAAGYRLLAERCLCRRTVFSSLSPFFVQRMPSRVREALARAFQAAPHGTTIERLVYTVLAAPEHYALIERDMPREALEGVRALLEELAPPGAPPLPFLPPLVAASRSTVAPDAPGNTGAGCGEQEACLASDPSGDEEEWDACDPATSWSEWWSGDEDDF